eukprot:g37231.t1
MRLLLPLSIFVFVCVAVESGQQSVDGSQSPAQQLAGDRGQRQSAEDQPDNNDLPRLSVSTLKKSFLSDLATDSVRSAIGRRLGMGTYGASATPRTNNDQSNGERGTEKDTGHKADTGKLSDATTTTTTITTSQETSEKTFHKADKGKHSDSVTTTTSQAPSEKTSHTANSGKQSDLQTTTTSQKSLERASHQADTGKRSAATTTTTAQESSQQASLWPRKQPSKRAGVANEIVETKQYIMERKPASTMRQEDSDKEGSQKRRVVDTVTKVQKSSPTDVLAISNEVTTTLASKFATEKKSNINTEQDGDKDTNDTSLGATAAHPWKAMVRNASLTKVRPALKQLADTVKNVQKSSLTDVLPINSEGKATLLASKYAMEKKSNSNTKQEADKNTKENTLAATATHTSQKLPQFDGAEVNQDNNNNNNNNNNHNHNNNNNNNVLNMLARKRYDMEKQPPNTEASSSIPNKSPQFEISHEKLREMVRNVNITKVRPALQQAMSKLGSDPYPRTVDTDSKKLWRPSGT